MSTGLTTAPVCRATLTTGQRCGTSKQWAGGMWICPRCDLLQHCGKPVPPLERHCPECRTDLFKALT